MFAAPTCFPSSRPGLPSKLWFGFRQAARRLRSFLKETPIRAKARLRRLVPGPSSTPLQPPPSMLKSSHFALDLTPFVVSLSKQSTASHGPRGLISTPQPAPGRPVNRRPRIASRTGIQSSDPAHPKPRQKTPRRGSGVFWKKLLCARGPRFAPHLPPLPPPRPSTPRPHKARTRSAKLSRRLRSGTVRCCLALGRSA